MRSFFIGCMALAVGSATGNQAAAQTVKPTRTVQLISMSAGSIPSRPAEAPQDVREGTVEKGAVVPQGRPEFEASFRVHDLSRRWVAFEMRNRFLSFAPMVAPANADDDPFAHVGVAPVGTASLTTDPLPPPLIPIPGWMRSGLAFSAAASRYAPGCATNAYRPAGFLSASAENRRLGYYALMSDVACEYGLPTGLFDAMIIRESGYQAAIYSPKNAFGLTQLMPDTAKGLGVNRYDIEQNLRGGAKYLRQQLDRFGQVHLALAAYNAGPGRVRNGMLPRIAETQAYVDNVLLNWQRLAGLARTATVQAAALQPPRRPQLRIGRTASISTF